MPERYRSRSPRFKLTDFRVSFVTIPSRLPFIITFHRPDVRCVRSYAPLYARQPESAPLHLSKIILISKAGIYEAQYNSISVEYRNTYRLWNRAFEVSSSGATTPTVRPVYMYTLNKPINRIKSDRVCMNFVRLRQFIPCDSYSSVYERDRDRENGESGGRRERERERVRMRECKYRRIKFNLFDRNERSLKIVTKEKTCASYYI